MKFQHLLIVASATLLLIAGNSRAFGSCGADELDEKIQSDNKLEELSATSESGSDHRAGVAKVASSMAILWTWVIAQSSYDTPITCPRIEFRSTEYFPGNLCPPGARHCSIGGYYQDSSGTIVMRNDQHLDDVHFRAMLAHEFVHYLQDRSGIWTKKSCRNRILREREAYHLQQRYLVAHHGSPFGMGMPVLDESRCSERIK